MLLVKIRYYFIETKFISETISIRKMETYLLINISKLQNLIKRVKKMSLKHFNNKSFSIYSIIVLLS